MCGPMTFQTIPCRGIARRPLKTCVMLRYYLCLQHDIDAPKAGAHSKLLIVNSRAWRARGSKCQPGPLPTMCKVIHVSTEGEIKGPHRPHSPREASAPFV